MAGKISKTVWIATSDQDQRRLLRAALSSQRVAALDFPVAGLFSGKPDAGALSPPAGSVLLIDRAGEYKDAPGLVEVVRNALLLPWQPRLLTLLPVPGSVWGNQREWVSRQTGHTLLERPQAGATDTLVDFLRAVHEQLELGEPDTDALQAQLRLLDPGGPREAPATRIRRVTGASPDELASALLAELAVKDRRLRLRKYRECMVGAEIAAWLRQRHGIGREDSELLGDALRLTGHLHHVTREQPFRDGDYFYRVAAPGRFDRIPVESAQGFLRGAPGLIADRGWRGTRHLRCLVGSEVVDKLTTRFGLTRAEATLLGQALNDLGLLRHVANDHPFADTGLLYRLVDVQALPWDRLPDRPPGAARAET